MSDLVVGLDTDSNGFHWVSTKTIDVDGRLKRYGWSVSKGDAEVRRRDMFVNARTFFEKAIDSAAIAGTSLHVFCEEPLALQNGKTTRILCMAAGAIWAAFVVESILDELRSDQPETYWWWVDVAEWKARVVGRGNANKAQIRDYVRANPSWLQEYGTADFEHDMNLYDAWCLQVFGSRQVASRNVP